MAGPRTQSNAKRSPSARTACAERRPLLCLVLLSFVVVYYVLGSAAAALAPHLESGRLDFAGGAKCMIWTGTFLWRHWYILVLVLAVPLLTEAIWGKALGRWLTYAYLAVLFLLLLLGYATVLFICETFVHRTPADPVWGVH